VVSLRRVLLVSAAVAYFMVQYAPFAAALSPDQLQLFNENINYFDIDSCGTANAAPAAGSGQPDGATFPNLDPASMASSIDQFVQKENPNSELKGLGSTIVASAKNSNINPFLIVAIAHEESSLSDPSDYNVSHGNNSFGREATSSQPHFNGSHLWYKWSSVKASVDYNAPENQGAAGGGDMATYIRDQYGSSVDSSNLVSLFLQYAPPSANNTTQYISNVKGWINDMVNGAGQAASGPAASSQSSTGCSCATSGTTLIGSDNKEKIFNYFIGKGLSPTQAAGIDGNFGQESGWNPSDPGGYLAQWGGGRLTALQALAQKDGKPVTDLGVQLDYVWLELTNGPGAGEDDSKTLSDLKAITGSTPQDVSTAADVFSNEYERPSDPQLQNRENYAISALQKYGGTASVNNPTSGGCAGAVDCNNPATSGLSAIRQSVTCRALAELAQWQSGQMKPGFRANSQDSYSKYSQNSDQLWCADFVSWVYNQASYPLQTSSTWRVTTVQDIQSIGQQNGNFHWHPAGSYTPKPGDLVIHLAGEAHVNIVTAVSGSTMTLVGGDQIPPFPDGSRVSQYTVNGFNGVDGITGYVSPD